MTFKGLYLLAFTSNKKSVQQNLLNNMNNWTFKSEKNPGKMQEIEGQFKTDIQNNFKKIWLSYTKNLPNAIVS